MKLDIVLSEYLNKMWMKGWEEIFKFLIKFNSKNISQNLGQLCYWRNKMCSWRITWEMNQPGSLNLQDFPFLFRKDFLSI